VACSRENFMYMCYETELIFVQCVGDASSELDFILLESTICCITFEDSVRTAQ
jgi:hypothetical protein